MADLEKAEPYDGMTRRKMQEGHRVKSRKALTRMSYLLTGVLILMVISLVFAPLCTSTLNVAVKGTGLTRTEHFEVRIDGAIVEQDDIAPGTIRIISIPYRFPWAFTGQKQITIVGTAPGTSGIDHSDLRTLTVADGGTYSVTLNL